MKKKIISAIATLALGAALIGGGTFAYYNDTETVNNSFASGTLNLDVNKNLNKYPMNFDLSNMKPGDYVSREIHIQNDGTLAAANVLMDIVANENDFLDGKKAQGLSVADSIYQDFFDQFIVKVIKVDDYGNSLQTITQSGSEPTLKDLMLADDASDLAGNFITPPITSPLTQAFVWSDGRVNVTPTGLYAGDHDRLRFEIEFKDSLKPDQNQFQGDSAKFQFVFEAKQKTGTTIEDEVMNGEISANGARTAPATITESNQNTKYDWPGNNTKPNMDGSSSKTQFDNDAAVSTDDNDNPIEAKNNMDSQTDDMTGQH